MERLTALVDTYEDTLNQLCMLFDDPTTLALHDIHAEMECLEKVSAKQAYIDAAFAHVCAREDAGRLVGGNWPSDYLEKALGISRGEAFRRLDRAKDLFDPPVQPPQPEESAPLFDPASSDTQDQTRSDSQEVSAKKQAIIDRELRKLTKHAGVERPAIFKRAMAEAKTRTPEDLHAFVRRLVDRANRKHKPVNDPNAGFDRRGVSFTPKKADGTRTMSVTLTEANYALIKVLLDHNPGPGSNIPDASADDTRMPAQRKFDQL